MSTELTIEEQRKFENQAENLCESIAKLSEFVRDNSNLGNVPRNICKIMIDSLVLAEEYMTIASATTDGVAKLSEQMIKNAEALHKKHFSKPQKNEKPI